MTNPVPLRERRDYIPYFKQRDAALKSDLKLFGIVFLLCVIASFINFIVIPMVMPPIASAQEVSPRSAYPLTNRGTCELIHDQGWKVEGASMSEVRALCKQNGIKL